MTVDRHRNATGRCRGALLAGLAALMLGAVPAAAEPTFVQRSTSVEILVGIQHGILVTELFDDAGTNARFTDVGFSTTEYYSVHEVVSPELILVETKTSEELNALASPPPNPFQVTVDVAMTNDEGQTASGTITLETVYNRTASTPLPEDETGQPFLRLTQTMDAPPGALITLDVHEVFQFADEMTGATFLSAEFEPDFHLDPVSGISANGPFTINVMALPEFRRPAGLGPDPVILFKAEVSARTFDGQEVSGTMTFQTTYAEDDEGPAEEQEQEQTSGEGADG